MRQGVFLFSILSAIAITSVAEAGESSFTKSIAPTQAAFITNNDLKAGKFFAAYTHSSVDERRFAEIYLLGVLDATEGKSWCDYKKFKTISIDEELYSRFKKIPESRMNDRASDVITEILGKSFPCQGAKK